MKKSATQSRKQRLDTYPADHNSAGVVDNSGSVGADDDEDLAQLVWKHFAEEISQALTEVQKALAPEQSGSSQQVSHQKNVEK